MKHRTAPVSAPRPTAIALAVASAFAVCGTAHALPTGEQVIAGQVSVQRPSAGAMTIQQGSATGIVNWSGFSIANGELVQIRQPGTSSVLLNRVVGSRSSEIFGRLSANGTVFLLNPNGVLFAPGSQVDVGSLVASTLSMTDQDFLAGRYRLAGTGGAVTNDGTITAADRGTVALLGGSVSNGGRIEARLGTVALAAGSRMTLDLAGDGLSGIAVTQAAVDAQVANGGAIVADGGAVLLTAHALNTLVGNTVNQNGIVRARSLVERDGRIVLDGGDGGTTMVSGTVDATGPAGTAGGVIQVLGTHVGLGGAAVLDASGDRGGGTVLVGGDYRGGNADVRNAATTVVAAGATLGADATGRGDGGKVVVWSDDSTRMDGAITARGGPSGGDGGLVETSGHQLFADAARVDASAPLGKAGTWLLDPINVTIDQTAANALGATLNTGTNVTVSTTGAGSVQGNITVAADTSILKNAGGDARLTLNANNNILINPSATIRSTVGRLSVDLDSDIDNSGFGGVALVGAAGRPVQIATNGGDFRIYGATDPAVGRASYTAGSGSGVTLYQTSVVTTGSAGDGGISIRGRGADALQGGFASSGVTLWESSLASGAGNIVVDGIAGRGGAQTLGGTARAFSDSLGIGSVVLGTSIVTTSGSVRINGVGADASSSTGGLGGEGINMRATAIGGVPSVISTGSGTITLVGTGGPGGSGSGGAEAGGAGGRGVNFSSTEVADGINTTSGQILLTGTGGSGGNGYTDGSDAAGGDGGIGVLAGRVTVSGAGGVAVVGTGGSGGDGGSGGAGAGGAAGIQANAINAPLSSVTLSGTGGAGGKGDDDAAGGAGGVGVYLFRSTLSGTVAASSLTVVGRGGDGGTSNARAAGGAGGNGVLVQNTLAVGSGTMSVTGSGGSGGNGGPGLDGLAGTDAPAGTIAAGGNGGSGDAAGAAGSGGDGILISGGSLTAGGAVQLVGSGGVGGSGGDGGFGGSGGLGRGLTSAGAGGAAGPGGAGGSGASGGAGVALQGSSISAPGSLSTVGSGGSGGIGGAGGVGGDGGIGAPGGIGGRGGSGGGGGDGGDGVALSAASAVTSGSIAMVGSGGVGADGGSGGVGGNGGAGQTGAFRGGNGGTGGAGGSPDHGGSGIRVTASTITATGAALSMTGSGAATGDPGVGGAGGPGGRGGNGLISFSAAGGAGGTGGDGGFSFGLSGGADGIDVVSNSILRAAAGDIALNGRSGTGAGAATAGAAGAGGIGGAGVGGASGGPSGAAGTVPVVGAAQLGGDGMRLISSTLNAANVRLTGLAEDVAPSPGQRGVSGVVSGDITVTASQAVDIRGLGSAGSGVEFGFSDVITSGSGSLWVTGDTTATNAPGLSVGPATVGGAGQTANIVLRARNGGGSDSIALYSSGDGISVGSVRTAGTLVLAPGGLSPDASTIVAANAVPITIGAQGTGFAIDPTDYSAIAPATGTVLFGSDTHTGAIQVAALGAVPFNLALQNEGSGSGGIVLSNGVGASGHTLTLATSGALTSGGPIVADALQVRGGAGTVAALNDPANAVNTLAVDPPARFSFVDSGPVRLGPVTGGNFSSSTGVAGTTTVTDSVSLGDFTVQTLAGAITLNQNIATSDPGSNITLAAATLFNNAAGRTLTPGAGGRWRIYANTWVGENRGGLTATFPNPNFYGCAYGAANCASGVTVPPAGNHFIYVQRPTATVAAANQSRPYGSANPTPTFLPTTGLVNGDTAADAFSGSLQQTAPTAAPIGQYLITTSVALTSPVGYNLSFAPGRLDVTPAALTIRANDQNRLYGGANQTPTRTVTGLVLNDTESVISGGIPFHTAVDRSPVGNYPIQVGAASASNYTITRVPGTLRIDPAPLTITANDQFRLYGGANPVATRTVSGLVLNETDAVISGGIPFQTAVDRSPVGNYAIPVGAASASNYTITPVPGTLRIDPAPLTITANDQFRLYGSANPVATRTVSGLVLNETDAVISGGIPFQTAVDRSPVGNYAIPVGAASASNYTITPVPGTLRIDPAPLTITANDQSRLYGSANPVATRTVSGLVLGETDAVISGGTPQQTAVERSNVGSYPIVVTDASSGNYRITTVPGALTVTPAPLTVAADDQRRLEATVNPPLTATFSGLVAGDTPAIVNAAGFRLTTPADVGSLPGRYAVTPSTFRLANYDVTELNGTLTILGSGRFENPTRDLLLLSSDLYERNRSVPAICTPSDPTALDRAATGTDVLSIEWTRVRQKPNVSNCLDLGQRNGCSDF